MRIRPNGLNENKKIQDYLVEKRNMVLKNEVFF